MDISIHALREEGDRESSTFLDKSSPISIHALREEGDARIPFMVSMAAISIHALREEGDCGCR